MDSIQNNDTTENKEKAFGLLDSLSQEEIKKAIEIADNKLKEIDVENDKINLQKDSITVPGQNFVAVSWIGPTFKAKTKNYGFRIMGAFDSLDSAKAHAIKINKQYPMFDTGIMQMNHFCLGYPDSSDFEGVDEETAIKNIDQVLNKFIIKHKTIKEYKKQLFELRKDKLKTGPTKTKEFDDVPENAFVPMGGDIPDEALKIHEENIKKIFKSENTEIKNEKDLLSTFEMSDQSLDLSPCNTKIHDQEYVIISYVGNEGKNKRIPINIKGVFSTKEEAEKHIENLMSIDDTYDIVVSPMYCWIPCDPLLDSVKQIYPNEKLNNMFEAHQNEIINTKSFHSAVKSTNEDVLTKVNVNSDKGTRGYSETVPIENDPELHFAVNEGDIVANEGDIVASELLKKCEIDGTSMFSYKDSEKGEEEKNNI